MTVIFAFLTVIFAFLFVNSAFCVFWIAKIDDMMTSAAGINVEDLMSKLSMLATDSGEEDVFLKSTKPSIEIREITNGGNKPRKSRFRDKKDTTDDKVKLFFCLSLCKMHNC